MRRSVRHIAAIAALALSSLGLGACAPGVQPLPLSERVATEIGTDTFRGPDGTLFPMRRWLPQGKPRAVIVALHGFGDYSVAFRTPAAYWASQGIATYAYDQRGFGGTPHVFHWAGTDTMADDAKAVVAALRKHYPSTPIYLLGESMGGAVTIVAGSGPRPADVDGLILVSPAIWEHNFMGSVERSALWLAGLAAPGWWLEPPRGLGIHPSDNVDMLRAMARDSLIQGGARVDTTAGLMDLMDRALEDESRVRLPMLALFGAHEQVLPHAAVSSFLARLPPGNARVAIYPQGYHMLLRDLHGDVVSKDIVSWIENRSAKLPSGDECAAAAASPPCKTVTS
ncbi:MAG TPA: lysophospholipase [Alphaproteobacteria bacterium]|nr:lysophospholipase [Alphaproteobacteria bacterium]